LLLLLPLVSLPTDSLQPLATNTTLKLLRFANRTDVPLAVSTLAVTNPFPLPYRAAPIAADVLPQLNGAGAAAQLGALRQRLVARQPGQDVLTQVLLQQTEPVVVVATGVYVWREPCSLSHVRLC
jgi:hypothetical protein